MPDPLRLLLLPDTYAICRLPADTAIPDWATSGRFCSVTRSGDELSIVCRQDDVPDAIQSSQGWRCLRIAGILDFALVGVLASLLVPLAETGVAVFVVSTFDTDYLLVREADRERAVCALRAARHSVLGEY